MLSPQGRIRAADLLFQLGKRDLADAMLAREDDLRPNGDAWFQTLYQRALLKKRAGEPEAASLYHALIENCLVTLNRQPGRTSLCILLGACYRDMGMREKAQEIFGLLRTILPGDARVEALESV